MTEKKIRKNALDCIELTKGFTGVPSNELKTIIDLSNDILYLTNNSWYTYDEYKPKNDQIVLLYKNGIILSLFKYYEKGAIGNSIEFFCDLNSKGSLGIHEIEYWRPLPLNP